MKPSFITFTGLDEKTDYTRVAVLSARYPVEWGVLFSPKRQGSDNRYPSIEFVSETIQPLADDERIGISLAAHICGDHAKAIMAGNDPDVDTRGFHRAQINSVNPDSLFIKAFGDQRSIGVIAQSRTPEFPSDDSINWLYDCSGGRGDAPDRWPRHPGQDRLVGYAGGLAPDTVKDQLALMDTSGRYWIDMESGIRTDDWLDLDKCQAVCEAVFGN